MVLLVVFYNLVIPSIWALISTYHRRDICMCYVSGSWRKLQHL